MNRQTRDLLSAKLDRVDKMIWEQEFHGTWMNDKPRYRELKKLREWLKQQLLKKD